MSYDETIRYLYNLRQHGIKFGLDNIKRLLSSLQNPHESFSTVHVAGTNGKGSVSAIMASMLHSAGLRVGLFTSPHLISFTERIRINGEEISEGDVIRLAAVIRDAVSGSDDFSPTFFEVITAMACLYFREKQVEIAVMETGMGGRLDATNIITPEVSVITNISYDHKEFLGDTLREIAAEKAGIIKQGVPVVSSCQEAEAWDALHTCSREKHADIFLYDRDFSGLIKKEAASGISFDYTRSGAAGIQDLFLPLAGRHQMQNASVAIRAATIVMENHALPSSSLLPVIREGLQSVRWPGRLEYVRQDPPVLIDGAHNPAAAAALAEAVKRTFLPQYEKIIIILGIMADKDITGIMEPLLPLAEETILTAPGFSRAATPDKLASAARSLGFSGTQTCPTVKDALDLAFRKGRNASFLRHRHPLILITGSFYTIGEAKEMLGQKGVLTGLREC
jgi:dihydrofolate synthase/folylpolyglutamate synthase